MAETGFDHKDVLIHFYKNQSLFEMGGFNVF